MKNIQFIPYYIPRETKLHHLDVIWKLILTFLYSSIILISKNETSILLYIIILSLVFLVLKFPLLYKGYVIFNISILLIGIFLESIIPAYLLSVFQVLGKMTSLTLLLGIFSMTTRITDLLRLFTRFGSLSGILNPLYYLINTSLAILPSVQYDLQRSIEAEEARKGKKVKFYSLISLINITIIIIVRTINRSNRFAQTVYDRGYSLQSGLSTIHERETFNLGTLTLILSSVLPGITVFLCLEL